MLGIVVPPDEARLAVVCVRSVYHYSEGGYAFARVEREIGDSAAGRKSIVGTDVYFERLGRCYVTGSIDDPNSLQFKGTLDEIRIKDGMRLVMYVTESTEKGRTHDAIAWGLEPLLVDLARFEGGTVTTCRADNGKDFPYHEYKGGLQRVYLDPARDQLVIVLHEVRGWSENTRMYSVPVGRKRKCAYSLSGARPEDCACGKACYTIILHDHGHERCVHFVPRKRPG